MRFLSERHTLHLSWATLMWWLWSITPTIPVNIDLVRITMNELPGTHNINNIVHIILNFYQLNKAEENLACPQNEQGFNACHSGCSCAHQHCSYRWQHLGEHQPQAFMRRKAGASNGKKNPQLIDILSYASSLQADLKMTELTIAECKAWDASLACYTAHSDGAQFGCTWQLSIVSWQPKEWNWL